MAKKQYVAPEMEIVEVDANDGNRYSLPYGIAKGLGLDTTGMRPREVWEMLKGRGITPQNEYDKLKEKATQEIPDEGVEVKSVSKYQTKADIEKWGNENNVVFSGLFNNMPEDKAVEQGRRMIELYEEFPVSPKSGASVYVSCEDPEKEDDISVAAARYYFSQDRVGIVYNKKVFNQFSEKEIEENVKDGWWCDTAPENYKFQTLNHEFGHAIEYSCLSRLGFKEYIDQKTAELIEKARWDYRVAMSSRKEAEKIKTNARKELFYDKVFPEIFKRANAIDNSIAIPSKILKKGYETAPRISGYGATSWAEYFAECFASGVGGNPTALGKATVEVVKDIFGGKFL